MANRAERVLRDEGTPATAEGPQLLFEKDDKIPRMTAYGPRQLELQRGENWPDGNGEEKMREEKEGGSKKGAFA
jgi:hypothetical protein